MKPEIGPTTSVYTRKSMKTNILTDSELLYILENGMFVIRRRFWFKF
jgi:hypothetical protein